MDSTEGMKKTVEDLGKANAEAMKRLDEAVKQIQENRRKQTEEPVRYQ